MIEYTTTEVVAAAVNAGEELLHAGVTGAVLAGCIYTRLFIVCIYYVISGVYAAVENALYAMIEADPSSRRLMIRNVPYTATETSLKQTVEAYGPIEDFKLVIDRNTGTKTRG